MKKIIALIFSALFVLSLASCGAKSERETARAAETEASEIGTAGEPTAETAASATESSAEPEKEETTAQTTTETTTEKETLDESRLTLAYIKTNNPNSKVNLRESPDADSRSLDKLANGSEIKIAGKEGDWYRVVANGKEGYIKAVYISDKKPLEFDPGYIRNGVYYNEWADLKFKPADAFTGQYSVVNDISSIFGKYSGFKDGIQFYDDESWVDFVYFRNDSESVRKELFPDIDTDIPHVSVMGHDDYVGIVNDFPMRVGLRTVTVYEVYWFRQIGEYTVLVRTASYGDQQRAQKLSNYISVFE